MNLRELRRFCAQDRFLCYALVAFLCLSLIGVPWDMPGFYGWENDGVAPRDFLGGIADNLTPGHAHRYPLFHYLIVGLVNIPVLLTDLVVALVRHEKVRDVVVSVPSMTAIAVTTKLLHVAMTQVTLLTLYRITHTLFTKTTARFAILFAITNLSVAYYGRSTNADGPYLMWVTLALAELLAWREGTPARNTRRLAVFVAAAVATKDQAYAPFIFALPLYALAIPLCTKREGLERLTYLREIGKTALLTLGAYAAFSGALLNPLGFVARLRLLTGSNSQDWRAYAPGLSSKLLNLTDILRKQDEFFWPAAVVMAAWLGVLLVVYAALRDRERPREPSPLWQLLPLISGLGSVFGFALVVGRAEHRFVLPLGLYLSVYAGHLVATLLQRFRSLWGTRTVSVSCGVLLLLGLKQNLELLMTEWYDPRVRVEQWLERLPRDCRIETYGLGVYLPRFSLNEDAGYQVTRVSALGSGKPPYIRGMIELRDDFEAVTQRNPDVLILPEGFANRFRAAKTKTPGIGQAMLEYRNATGATSFFRALLENRLPDYVLTDLGRSAFPRWYVALGGRNIRIHGSTGEPVWVAVHRRLQPVSNR